MEKIIRPESTSASTSAAPRMSQDFSLEIPTRFEMWIRGSLLPHLEVPHAEVPQAASGFLMMPHLLS
ncbi:hypothetical protein SDC9_156125 [bioreactor metagenome]|uniref:Uncharacterized protein n=1 Tax=bioreactor metagenome TaxID=1076179 RepID=A0A645F5Y3_9ZZZZ